MIKNIARIPWGAKTIYPRTPKEALLEGSQFYFTGEKCVRGHVSVRNTKTRLCMACQHERSRRKKFRKEKPLNIPDEKQKEMTPEEWYGIDGE